MDDRSVRPQTTLALCQQSVPRAIVKGLSQNSELTRNPYDVSNSVSENGLSPDDKRSRRETLILLSQVFLFSPFLPFFIPWPPRGWILPPCAAAPYYFSTIMKKRIPDPFYYVRLVNYLSGTKLFGTQQREQAEQIPRQPHLICTK